MSSVPRFHVMLERGEDADLGRGGHEQEPGEDRGRHPPTRVRIVRPGTGMEARRRIFGEGDAGLLDAVADRILRALGAGPLRIASPFGL